jgi:predicted helicase
VLQQNEKEIRVIVGNPPYSVGQRSANDANPNESYPSLDRKIAETYVANTNATNKNSLYDSYIRAFRWASDRIGNAGIICYVSNAGWLDGQAMDGFRKCLTEEFTSVHVFNLRGNARTSGEERRKEKDNVFGQGTRTPIAITMLVKNLASSSRGLIYYHDIGDYYSREDKLAIVRSNTIDNSLPWQTITPDSHNDWLNLRDDSFQHFAPMGISKYKEPMGIFATWSNGNKTQRDAWAINYSKDAVSNNMASMIEVYNNEVMRYQDSDRNIAAVAFVNQDPKLISWTAKLFNYISKGSCFEYRHNHLTRIQYRPFTRQWVYYDPDLNERTYQQPRIFPSDATENFATFNKTICVSFGKVSMPLMTNVLPDIQLQFNGQCFPLYWYEKLEPIGGLFAETKQQDYIQHEAITDQALSLFQQVYPAAFDQRSKADGGPELTKEDIFYYIYGVLHSPEYRERFAANLKKELPRIPLSANFRDFSEAGRKLADLHLNYETIDPFPLEEVGNSIIPGRTIKMRFGKTLKTSDNPRGEDNSTIHVSENLTVKGIPEAAYRYIVNGKTAIGWLMDRYQVTTDKASGIVNDPNDYCDDPRYIIDLVKRVVRISLETMEIVDNLPPLAELPKPVFWPAIWK